MKVCQICPTELSCEYATDPLGIDALNPALSWVVRSEARDQVQTAYRIIVSSSETGAASGAGDIWDTGKTVSREQICVRYDGPPLESFRKYWWVVMLWDGSDAASDWSEPACWEMGVLRDEDWQATWISAPEDVNAGPLLRREFEIAGGVRSARAYVSGLGYSEIYINGERSGDSVLDPAQTDYQHRVFYSCHDITAIVRTGDNAVGVMLGNGWYNQDRVWGGLSYGRPCVLLMLRIEADDGTVQTIGSGPEWRCTTGPIVSDNVYAGEVYDARLEIPGWAEAGLDDSAWVPAKASESPGGQMMAQPIQPIKRMGTLDPVNITSPEQRVLIYDMGQNFSGWARVQLDGLPRGTTVTVRYAERLDERGRLATGSTGVQHTGVVQTDSYVCRGDGTEVYEPRFTYHGFRYAEVARYAGEATVDKVKGVVVHTAVDRTGSFECSDPMINKIHEAAVWTQLSNLHGTPTDCPHRERCGWLGDAHICAEMSIYNFDMARVWAKYAGDMETTARDGGPKMITPGKRTCGEATPDWGTAVVQLPWYLYLYYGDTRTLEASYPMMQRWMEHLGQIADGAIVRAGLGDWCAPDSLEGYAPTALISTGYYYLDATIMASASRALGHSSDTSKYGALAASIREAFVAEFWDGNRQTYGSQTGDAFALRLGLAPEGCEQAAADSLASDVTLKHRGHHSTGITGSRHLFWALARYGHGDVALEILRKKDYPSYGQLFEWGATTLWENWGEKWIDAQEGERSLNHPMQGGLDAWFYSGLAGINPSPEGPGFRRMVLHPQIIGDINYVRASYKSVAGEIVSEWQVKDGSLFWDIVVPANCEAEVYVPHTDPDAVAEGGSAASDAQGLAFAAIREGCSVFLAGSGKYSLRCPAPERKALSVG